jgi:hypothetical protein
MSSHVTGHPVMIADIAVPRTKQFTNRTKKKVYTFMRDFRVLEENKRMVETESTKREVPIWWDQVPKIVRNYCDALLIVCKSI